MYVKYLIVLNNLYIDGLKRYNDLEEIKRLNRVQLSYKLTKEQVKYAIQKLKLKENEQITMEELHKIIKKKYG